MGKNSGNQYRARATRRAGSEDMDMQDKLKVKKIMQERGYDVAFNMFLLVPRDPEHTLDYILLKDVPVTYLQKWKLAARPDVVCDKGPGEDTTIIEIDGGVHKRELDSRNLYEELGIEHIIINKDHMDKTGESWESWIDRHLEDDNAI